MQGCISSSVCLWRQAAAGRRGRVKSYGTRHGSGGVACRCLARFAMNPPWGAGRAFHRPEDHYQAEAHPRPDQPHRPSPANQKSAQRQMSRITPEQAVPKTEVEANTLTRLCALRKVINFFVPENFGSATVKDFLLSEVHLLCGPCRF